MPNALSSYLDKGMFLEHKRRTAISLEGLSFILNESLQHPSEVSPPSIKDIRRCLARRNHRDYLGTPFGTMPLSYSQEPPPHYPDDSFPSPRARLPKHKNL